MCIKKGDNYIIVVSLSDLDGTNFYKFYGGFEEIGLLYVGLVLVWLKEFGLAVLLGFDERIVYNFESLIQLHIRTKIFIPFFEAEAE